MDGDGNSIVEVQLVGAGRFHMSGEDRTLLNLALIQVLHRQLESPSRMRIWEHLPQLHVDAAVEVQEVIVRPQVELTDWIEFKILEQVLLLKYIKIMFIREQQAVYLEI